jgi:hypothetical protein
MTLGERAANYSVVFPRRPPMRANNRWLEGTWIGGNNYGNYILDSLDRLTYNSPIGWR